jgi:hypothetical protein
MHPARPLRRLLALAVFALFVAAARAGALHTWAFWVALAAPDLALLAGTARGLQKGQLHPRAVRLYNAVHHPLPPVDLGALALLTGTDLVLAGALGWAAHVAMDRVAGYGLREADGFQRSEAAAR